MQFFWTLLFSGTENCAFRPVLSFSLISRHWIHVEKCGQDHRAAETLGFRTRPSGRAELNVQGSKTSMEAESCDFSISTKKSMAKEKDFIPQISVHFSLLKFEEIGFKLVKIDLRSRLPPSYCSGNRISVADIGVKSAFLTALIGHNFALEWPIFGLKIAPGSSQRPLSIWPHFRPIWEIFLFPIFASKMFFLIN